MKKIAYLAPEIPSFSATFVYNEILSLEKNHPDLEILPISIHEVKNLQIDDEVLLLKSKTLTLYPLRIKSLIKKLLLNIIKKPFKIIKVLFIYLEIIFSKFYLKDGLKLFYHLLSGNYLAEILEKEKIEHLHIHFAHFPTQIGMFASLISDIPFSFTAHANDIFENGKWLEKKIKYSKYCFTISGYNKNYFKSLKVNLDKVKIIRCFPLVENRERKNEKEKSIIKIGTLGRFVEKKGIDDLIIAFSIIKNNNLNLHIAGDGPLKEKLVELTNNLNLQDKIFFDGKINHKDIPDWMLGLDLFVLACKKDKKGDMDGIPVVLMEAIKLNIPVISTNISGIPELIENNTSGLLADPNNPYSLADTINKYFDNPNLKENFVNNSLKIIESEFSEKTNITKIYNYITEKRNKT